MIVTLFIIRISAARKGPAKQAKLDEWFQDEYVCPNPQCHHFLGNQRYDLILRNGCCPWCKSTFKE